MKITIATYNCGLFQVLFKDFVPKVNERVPLIAQTLKNIDADIIFLQEVFLQKHWDLLTRALSKTHPYHIKARGRKPYYSPGLCVLSKFPLRSHTFERYAQQKDIEKISNHGFLQCTFKIKGRIIDCCSTHLSAGGIYHGRARSLPGAIKTQQAQLAQLFSAAKSPDTILVGDFNCGPKRASASFHTILDAGWIDGATKHAHNTQLSTLTRHENPLLHKRHLAFPADRVDHLFLRKESRFLVTSVSRFGDQIIAPASTVPSDHFGLLFTLDIGS